ncbi:hypothetical protein JXA02_08395 [candidate division KSB1 bacterium]|nr:hypothetical protein [candidate division KSB1 bacterium]RQW05446.1 MAG: hypothetical protein EH222_09890 [candidate division KSB1 bacterium]
MLPCALNAGVPSIGAQIWIEPGQTEAEIDGWSCPETWSDWREFCQEHLTWYMQWIESEYE